MDRIVKTIRFPVELVNRIKNVAEFPDYMDFSSRLFLLIEKGLKACETEPSPDASKKNSAQSASESARSK